MQPIPLAAFVCMNGRTACDVLANQWDQIAFTALV